MITHDGRWVLIMLSRHMEKESSHLVQNEQHTATQAVAEYECGYEHELGGLMACVASQVGKVGLFRNATGRSQFRLVCCKCV